MLAVITVIVIQKSRVGNERVEEVGHSPAGDAAEHAHARMGKARIPLCRSVGNPKCFETCVGIWWSTCWEKFLTKRAACNKGNTEIAQVVGVGGRDYQASKAGVTMWRR